MSKETHAKENPHVVIIGAGFAGLQAARDLDNAPVQVTLIDKQNYHLFQPLLYQVATAGLSPEDIAHPVRAILRGQDNLNFRNTEVIDVKLTEQRLVTKTGELHYDYLIIAAGGTHNFFGLRSVAAHSFGLKTIEEAVSIRNHVLERFELANQENDADKRRAMLTFVVVGGGPTGVESAGALSELFYKVLTKDYPRLNFKEVRILLLEAGQNLLPAVPEDLQEFTTETLWKKHVEVRFGAMVTDFDGERVTLKGGEIIPAQTLIWAAGVRAAGLIDMLGVNQGSLARAIVTPTLQLSEHPEVFVIGDAAHCEENGKPLPMNALVALQQGSAAASNIWRLLQDDKCEPFIFHDLGSMATIGRNSAVAKIGSLKIKGLIAWLLWTGVHIVRLAGFRNRLFVFWKWFWDYIFYERAVRLITKE
ncbi:NAD(P)/FAD-dependent oxidoreductase [Anaerospora sp.]|uniref:NAD(P)/FAD-dependent oxidoreductase n=1 Tax=Anaerospora sp. TaxID=1960278 RepID=UPI00289BA4F2|nr:NAD(P)/FAD-dependent oxidoreductase [Anaerospora sp.]